MEVDGNTRVLLGSGHGESTRETVQLESGNSLALVLASTVADILLHRPAGSTDLPAREDDVRDAVLRDNETSAGTRPDSESARRSRRSVSNADCQ